MTYKAGIIGTGGIAGMGILGMHDEDKIGQEKVRASHAGGYDATDGIELVAVADVDKEKLSRFGEAWDIPQSERYEDHETMLDNEELDVVSVCTPTLYHHDHVIDAATSASDPSVIWCEKPIASSVVDAEKMIDRCAEENTELVINHSFRFTEKFQQVRELLQVENLLGEIHSVSGQFRMELMRNSTHLLDTLIFLLDARAQKVSGYITGENEAVDALDATQRVDDAGGGGMIILEDGTFTTVDCTVPRGPSSMNYHILGEDGKMYLNNDDSEWRYWSLEDGDHVEQPLPGIPDAFSWDSDYREAFPNAASHITNLLDEETKMNRSTGEDATRSLEIIIAFYISHFTGSQVSIPLDQPLRDVTITSW